MTRDWLRFWLVCFWFGHKVWPLPANPLITRDYHCGRCGAYADFHGKHVGNKHRQDVEPVGTVVRVTPEGDPDVVDGELVEGPAAIGT